MPGKNIQGDLSHIKNLIMSLESMVFRGYTPVNFDKINCDSNLYDIQYDKSVRKKESAYFCLLNELMLAQGKESEAWQAINKIENTLASPEYYRRLIFDGQKDMHDKYVMELSRSLEKEIDFLEKNLTGEQYLEGRFAISDKGLPETKKDFFDELKAVLQNFSAKLILSITLYDISFSLLN